MVNENELRTILAEVNDILRSGGQSETVQVMILLLKAQEPAGCWEHSGNPSCTALQTTQAMDALLVIGNENWLYNSESPLRLGARWLCNNQYKSSGKWGQDPFDTAEVLRVLLQLKHSLLAQGIVDPTLDDPIQRGIEYLRLECNKRLDRFSNYRGYGWYGPAFWASAAVVFYLLNDLAITRELNEEIWSFRRDVTDNGGPEGGCAYFECPEQVNDENLRIWNTAQTIIGLTRLSELGPTKSELAPFVRWLEYRQNCEPKRDARIYGSWGNDAAQVGGDSLPICTYSAIVAIHRANGPKAQVDLGVGWFNRLIRKTNEEIVLGTTALCAGAAMYAEVFGGKKFMPSMPLDTILKLVEIIENQVQGIQDLGSKLVHLQQHIIEIEGKHSSERNELISARDKLRKELDEYFIKIRREGLGFWVLIGLIISMLGIVISLILAISV
jgi:hypothetical protein